VVLASLNRLTPPVHVSTGRVAVTDAHGLRPLFETVRYREAYPLPPLVVVEFSDAVRRLLTLLDVPCTERLDVDAWDRAYRRPPQPHERRRGPSAACRGCERTRSPPSSDREASR